MCDKSMNSGKNVIVFNKSLVWKTFPSYAFPVSLYKTDGEVKLIYHDELKITQIVTYQFYT